MVTEKGTLLTTVPESLPGPENSNTSEWVVIDFNPTKTPFLAEQFRVMEVEIVIPGRKILPGYLFAQIDTNSISMGWINSLNGVKGVVTFGEDYGRVPNSDIETIKKELYSDDPAERLKGVFDQKLPPKQRMFAFLEAAEKHKTNFRPLQPA